MNRALNRLTVPTADATTDTFMRDVIGDKSDAASGVVADTTSMMAYVKALVEQAPQWVAGTTDTDPLATMSIFTISDGPVMIHEIIGIVTTTAIEAAATTVQLVLDPTDGGTNVDMSSAGLDATGDVTGTVYRWTKDLSAAIVALLDTHEATATMVPGAIVNPGDIIATYGATSDGQINWYCLYTSLGGTLAAA